MEGLSPKIDVVSILKYISEGSKLQLSWFSIKTGHREGGPGQNLHVNLIL